MAIPVLNFLSTFLKGFQPRRENASPHAMLAGLNAEVFLRQWGAPEVKTTLGQIEALFKLDRPLAVEKSNLVPQQGVAPKGECRSLSTKTPCLPQGPITVWIYKKMDRILFFRGDKLMSHFKWTQFKRSLVAPREGIESRERPEKRACVEKSRTTDRPRTPPRMAIICL
jgi:hypothetical protein